MACSHTAPLLLLFGACAAAAGCHGRVPAAAHVAPRAGVAWPERPAVTPGAPADDGAEDVVAAVEDVEPESAPSDTAPSVDAADVDPSVAGWLPPVVGRITSRFGMRDDDSMHDAVDIAAPMGTEVAAPTDLAIRTVAYQKRAGRYIIGDTLDGAYVLTFAHLSHTEVFEGQRVARGELLGLTGISGSVTGPHLHFRVERVVDDCGPARAQRAHRGDACGKARRVAVDPLTVFSARKITGGATIAAAP